MMKRFDFRRLALAALAIGLSGCEVIRGVAPLFLPNAPTAVPTATLYPTATPQPAVTLTFRVSVPPNTPAGSSINLVLPDLVGNAAGKTFILTNTGGNVWAGSVAAPVGALLRYRYQRVTGTQAAAEVRADGSGVAYRTAVVSGPLTIDETVAAWSDIAFLGEKGQVRGIVRDVSSNAGLPGIIVSAGGQQTLTGFDGEYVIGNLPANAPTTVTAFAPDGAFRAAMNTATPPANASAGLDFGLAAARTVKVNFVVAAPTDTPAGAVVWLVGNVLQLGDTFVVNGAGSTTHPQRQVALAQLADGRWATSLLLYEGTDLRYKYTLGSATVNGELHADGSGVLRQYVLPGRDDVIVEDQVATWKSSLDAPVSFAVTAPALTPPADIVTVQFKIAGVWREPLPMWRRQLNDWHYTLWNPLDFPGDLEYRFCRNYQCGTADDGATFGPNPAGYHVTPTLLPQSMQNTVGAWQWWVDVPPPALSLPAVTARPSFQAGFELDLLPTSATPALPLAFDSIKATSANWVRLPVAWDTPSANPPIIAFDFSRSLFRQDLIAAVRAARDRGFKVALYPVVRPSSNGPFGGDLNLFFDAGFKDTAWWDAWFREYARFLAYFADLAAFTGADAYYVGDASLFRAFPGAAGAPADAEARWRNIIAALRRDHYDAQLVFGLHLAGQAPALSPPPPFLDMVDVIDVRLSAALTPSPTASLEELKANAANMLDLQLIPLRDQFNKLIVITAQYLSVDGGAAQCPGLASGGCQPAARLAPDQPDSSLYPLDLAEQALAYEALLYALNDRAWVSGFYGFGYNPTVALRDKYYSPRGKPAESLLSAWFARIK